MSGRRQIAWRFGRTAETLAAWVLRLKGYRIISRGHRSAVGEIDIIARRGGLLAFVEVKARAGLRLAAEALGPAQRRRIERAAEAFLASHPEYSGCDVRFDVMLVTPLGLPRHLAGAWMFGD